MNSVMRGVEFVSFVALSSHQGNELSMKLQWTFHAYGSPHSANCAFVSLLSVTMHVEPSGMVSFV
jgi:hypothetical protein